MTWINDHAQESHECYRCSSKLRQSYCQDPRVLLLLFFQQQRECSSGKTEGKHSSQVLASKEKWLGHSSISWTPREEQSQCTPQLQASTVHNSLCNHSHPTSADRFPRTWVCGITLLQRFPAQFDTQTHGKGKAVFSPLTSEISSDHVGDDAPWPDPLGPGRGCPAHSGRGVCIHPRLICVLLPPRAPCKRCVLPAVCKTEWQHCLNPL